MTGSAPNPITNEEEVYVKEKIYFKTGLVLIIWVEYSTKLFKLTF